MGVFYLNKLVSTLMGLRAWLTLAGSIVFTTSAIAYEHYSQRETDKQMKSAYQVALEEKAKEEEKLQREAQREENRLYMIHQEKLTKQLIEVQREIEENENSEKQT